MCNATQLTITGRGGEGGTGHESELLVFANKSAGTCFMQGYPGVALRRIGRDVECAAHDEGVHGR